MEDGERRRWLGAVETYKGNVDWYEGRLALARSDMTEAVRRAREAGITPAELAPILGCTPAHVSRIAPLQRRPRSA